MSAFGSGHDLEVHKFESHIRLSDVSAEPASHPLSLSLFAPPLLVRTLSLSCFLSKINKHKKNAIALDLE